MTVIIIALVITWHIIGLPVAKTAYRNAIRTHRLNPQISTGDRPERPKIKVNEMLHQGGVDNNDHRIYNTKRCELLDGKQSCNCKYRQDWINLREQWRLYDEWKPGDAAEPKPAWFIWAVPFWPLVLTSMYISQGAKGIPDPKRLERVRIELAELDKELKALE